MNGKLSALKRSLLKIFEYITKRPEFLKGQFYFIAYLIWISQNTS